MIRILFTVALTCIAILYAQLGLDWLNTGHGLHPAVAFPIATLAIIAIIVLILIARRHDQAIREYIHKHGITYVTK